MLTREHLIAGIPEDQVTVSILPPRIAAITTSPQHHRSSPPPLSCISEDVMEHSCPHEHQPQQVSSRLKMLCNPQISITDELGATVAGGDDPLVLPTSTFPSIVPSVLRSCDPLRPSITRGIGKVQPTTQPAQPHADSANNNMHGFGNLQNNWNTTGDQQEDEPELQKTSSGSFEVGNMFFLYSCNLWGREILHQRLLFFNNCFFLPSNK